MFKYKEIVALLIGLMLILVINPGYVYGLYDTILGKLVLLILVSFLAMKNITLGLLVALALIILSRQYGPLVEGMETIKTPDTVGSTEKKEPKQTIVETNGIDISSIEDSVRSKQSQSIPVDKSVSSSSENVSPFTSGMLTSETTLTEGFCPCAAALM